MGRFLTQIFPLQDYFPFFALTCILVQPKSGEVDIVIPRNWKRYKAA